ncbi:hypothetical protein ACA910_018605 [Epithemia clementina (nom. ined.)]
MLVDRANFVLRTGILALSSMAENSLSLADQPLPLPSSCAVVGVGVLGTSLCRQILKDPSLSHVKLTGITRTNNRHASILEEILTDVDQDVVGHRFELMLSDNVAASDTKYDNVVFCAPPSGFDDYPKAVQEAASTWAGPNSGRGVFLFTCSGSVYAQDSGVVSESSPVNWATTNPRVERLVKAEEACLEAGGACLRLAGLYNLQRGAHNFWLTSGKVIAGSPDGLINQVHYDDAAGACLAALKAGPEKCNGKVFLVSDSHPMTRQQICESSLQAAVYRGTSLPQFSSPATGKPTGKTYDCSTTYEQLNWKPMYESFDDFMKSNS